MQLCALHDQLTASSTAMFSCRHHRQRSRQQILHVCRYIICLTALIPQPRTCGQAPHAACSGCSAQVSLRAQVELLAIELHLRRPLALSESLQNCSVLFPMHVMPQAALKGAQQTLDVCHCIICLSHQPSTRFVPGMHRTSAVNAQLLTTTSLYKRSTRAT